MIDATENPRFQEFMKMVDKFRTLGVRTNADTPEGRRQGPRVRRRGHRPVPHRAHVLRQGLRRAAVPAAQDDPEQHRRGARKALDELFPFVKRDIKATLEAMDGLPVTIRLLDPPLHEFVPQSAGRSRPKLAKALGITSPRSRSAARRCTSQPDDGPPRRAPGHHLSRGDRDADPRDLRGRRRADQGGKKCKPEIMIPVTCDVNELEAPEGDLRRSTPRSARSTGVKKIDHLYGTMIEIPRAAAGRPRWPRPPSSSASAPTT
jgi:pyruvate, orthophosphate dikinase